MEEGKIKNDTQWSMKVLNCPWTEDTISEITFTEKFLDLSRNEQVLDLGCGFGRHSLSLARLGYSVVGVDSNADYISHARDSAAKEHLNIEFICSDILDLRFQAEFDVVLSLCDGGIGYFLEDSKNEGIFEVIHTSLKPGGKYLLQVLNKRYAEEHFPCRDWDIGNSALSVIDFGWNPHTSRMHYKEKLIYKGLTFKELDEALDISVRLYTYEELERILIGKGFIVEKTSSSLTEDKLLLENSLIMVVRSTK